jgi:hypothetical protein
LENGVSFPIAMTTSIKKRFRKRLAKPVRLAELVDKRAKRWRFQHLGRMEVIRTRWKEAAGEFVARNVIPVRLVRKQLRLAVSDSSWASEMAYLKDEILERLLELLPKGWIKEIKVVTTEPFPAEDVLDTQEFCLAPTTEDMHKKADQVASLVSDPNLSQAIKRARISQLRREDTF